MGDDCARHSVLQRNKSVMRVLVACEYSGVVRDAFARRGHDSWSCDLIDTEQPENHIRGNVIDILADKWGEE